MIDSLTGILALLFSVFVWKQSYQEHVLEEINLILKLWYDEWRDKNK